MIDCKKLSFAHKEVLAHIPLSADNTVAWEDVGGLLETLGWRGRDIDTLMMSFLHKSIIHTRVDYDHLNSIWLEEIEECKEAKRQPLR